MTTDDVKMRCQEVPVGKSKSWGKGLCGNLSSAWYHVVFWICHLQFSSGKKLDPVFLLDQWIHYCSARKGRVTMATGDQRSRWSASKERDLDISWANNMIIISRNSSISRVRSPRLIFSQNCHGWSRHCSWFTASSSNPLLSSGFSHSVCSSSLAPDACYLNDTHRFREWGNFN